jgi:hypothetical protein
VLGRPFWIVLLTTALAFVVMGASSASAGVPATAADRDCGDFSSQREAQSYFLRLGGPSSDPDRLDADNDGIACDANPCPCYYGQSLPDSDPSPSPQPKRIPVLATGVRQSSPASST